MKHISQILLNCVSAMLLICGACGSDNSTYPGKDSYDYSSQQYSARSVKRAQLQRAPLTTCAQKGGITSGPADAACLSMDSVADSSQLITDDVGRIHYIVDLLAGSDAHYPQGAAADDRFPAYQRSAAKNLVYDMERQYGVRATTMTSWVGLSFSAFLSPQQLRSLENDPRVERISADQYLSLSTDAGSLWADSTSGGEIRPWGKAAVNATAATLKGNIVVYVIDSGVGFHEDLNVIQRISPMNPGDTTPGHLVGCYAHSTHVAGIIGAKVNGRGIQGVDPNVGIISVTALNPASYDSANDCLNAGPTANFIGLAMDWVKSDITKRGEVGIVNISINTVVGPNNYAVGGTLGAKMKQLATPSGDYPGGFIVQSAGNQYEDACLHAYDDPSADDGIMVIGAVNDHAQPITPLSDFPGSRNTNALSEAGSNYGKCVAAWAPGHQVLSTFAAKPQKASVTYATYSYLTGTSMAAPHVAGLAAYLAETEGLATSVDIEQRVRALLYSLGSKDKTGLTLSLPSKNPPTGGTPHSTPYAEIVVSTRWFAPKFAPPAQIPSELFAVANGTTVLYSDADPFTMSLDSLGASAGCDVSRAPVAGGSPVTSLGVGQAQYYWPSQSWPVGSWKITSTACPSASALVTVRPAPKVHWWINGVEKTGAMVALPVPTKSVLKYTSENTAACELTVREQRTGPIRSVPNGPIMANVALETALGRYNYTVTCKDMYGFNRSATLDIDILSMPTSGSWWNPSRSGNGWNLSHTPDDGQLVVTWFTYQSTGSATWYNAVLSPMFGVESFSGLLTSSQWSSGSPKTTVRGTVTLSSHSPTAADFYWELDGRSGNESIQYLATGSIGSAPNLTGQWFPPGESGWGQVLDIQGAIGIGYVVLYDSIGQPTWVYGTGTWNGSSFPIGLYQVVGTNLCPGCIGSPSTSHTTIGSMAVTNINPSRTRAAVSVSLASPLSGWNRTSLGIARLTN